MRWTVQVGLAGFAAGYVGPLFLTPDANQGPLLGIFFSGPASAGAGLVVGLLATAVFQRDARLLWRLLHVTSALVAAATLAWIAIGPD